MGITGKNWVAALVMGLIIAASAGTPISTALMLLPETVAIILALPLQVIVFVISVFLLMRIEPPMLQWGWGASRQDWSSS